MKKYKRLTSDEREEISRMLAQKCSFQAIATTLHRQISTISREVNADSDNKYIYRAGRAQGRAVKNSQKRKAGKHILDKNQKLKDYIYQNLRIKWSPVQIVKNLTKEYPLDMTMRISHEAIYSYLYVLPRGTLKKELLGYLRQNRKYRHKQHRGVKTLSKIKDMLSIEERPKEVENRIIPGHWEGDLIIGKNSHSALGTLVERTTRTTILVPVKSKNAEHVAKQFAKEIKKLPQQMKLSLTYDQGGEMANHKLFTDITGVKVYFAHPHSPWERGTNENTNGLLRQYFPKGTDFNKISRRTIKKAQDELNGRPRKTLNYCTPFEIFNQLINSNIVALKT